MIDTQALSRQLHQIHMEICADMQAQREAHVSGGPEWLTVEWTALRNLLSAVSLTASLADAVTDLRLQPKAPSIPTQSTGEDR